MKTILHSLAIFLCIFSFALTLNAQSSKSKKLYKDALAQYAVRDYENSLDLCLQIIQADPDYSEAKLLTAKNYYQLNELDHVLSTLDKMDVDNSEDALFIEALTYKSMGEYEKAIAKLDDYISKARLVNQQQQAKIEKDGALLAMENLAQNDENFSFSALGEPINTPDDEYAVFTINNPKKILVSRIESNDHAKGENVKYLSTPEWMKVNDGDEFEFLNTPDSEGAGVFDQDAETFYFTKCTGNGEKLCQIYVSRLVNNIWQQAIPVSGEVNDPDYNSIDPMLSTNGDTLFYSSDRRGGFGKYDIWYSVKSEESWSDPVNLGAPINTVNDEMAPFAHSDGTFYFASDGHAGFGKLDLYYVNSLSGKREIHNLGAPFNSPLNDKHISLIDHTGYLASDRKGGNGGYDIYSFKQQSQAEEVSADESEEENILYSVIFISKLYDEKPRFISPEFDKYSGLSESELEELNNQVDASLSSLSAKEKKQIKEEDKILLASLSDNEKFFIERIVAGFYENNAVELNLSEEDIELYQEKKPEEKREVYRMSFAMYNDLNEEFSKEEEPVATEENIPSEELVAQEEDEVEEEKASEPETAELESESEPESKPVTAQQQEETEEPVAESAEKGESADQQFTNLLGVDQSVQFYQNLPFTVKKRVDRIMAIRLVNEKYVLAPDLSSSDRNYYHTLSQREQASIDRLKKYFQSWNKNQEMANLKESDLDYLASLDPAKRAKVARIIVRRGIGVDSDNFVRFSGSDWSKYKNFNEQEIQNIKEIANLLRKNDQMFDVALAYAGPDYQLNNNLAAIYGSPSEPNTPVASTTSTDPEIPASGPGQLFESVYFDPGAFRLRQEAVVALNELIEVYQNNPQILIGLKAYSGDYASQADNVQLSNKRVNTARNYLLNQGVPDVKIKPEVTSIAGNPSLQTLSALDKRKLELKVINYNAPLQSDYTTYLIQPGNTLYSLAKANNISVEELKSLNGLNSNLIIAYKPLRVKKTATLDPDLMVNPSTQLVYEEPDTQPQPEQTAKEEPQPEERGEEIMVFDTSKDEAPKETIYVVERGESIEDVSEKFDVTVEEIVEWNELKKAKVKRGQELKIMQ